MSLETIDVCCLNCYEYFYTKSKRKPDETVTCTNCGAKHVIDTDEIDGNTFWYLSKLIQEQQND